MVWVTLFLHNMEVVWCCLGGELLVWTLPPLGFGKYLCASGVDLLCLFAQKRFTLTQTHCVNSTDMWQLCRYEAVWELALKPPYCYKSGFWVLFFGIVEEEKKRKKKEKRWYSVIYHLERRILWLLDDVFPYLQCFSNPLECRQTDACLLSLGLYFPTVELCCGAKFSWQRDICEILSVTTDSVFHLWSLWG